MSALVLLPVVAVVGCGNGGAHGGVSSGSGRWQWGGDSE